MSTTPFGPRLIGETEKTLNELLRRCLDRTALGEPHWVTMRLAEQLGGTGGTAGLVAAVADRAHFADAPRLVADLTARGLLDGGGPTSAGRQLIEGVQTEIATRTAAIWDDLPAEDVAATARVLNEVLARAHAALR